MHVLQPRPRGAIVTAGVAALAMVAAVAAFAMVPIGAALTVGAALAVTVLAADVDRRAHRIPDVLVGAALVPLVLMVSITAEAQLVTSVLASIALLAGPLLVIHLVSPAAMGFGDVKLAVALGAIVGVVDWRLAVAALFVASLATGLVGLLTRRPMLPFGPGLVVGAAAAIIGGAFLIEGAGVWH